MSTSITQAQKIKRIVWTGSIAAVTATGAWYGAGLKTRKERSDAATKARALTTAEKITKLEEQKAGLRIKQKALENKIAEVRSRGKEGIGKGEEDRSMVGRANANGGIGNMGRGKG